MPTSLVSRARILALVGAALLLTACGSLPFGTPTPTPVPAAQAGGGNGGPGAGTRGARTGGGGGGQGQGPRQTQTQGQGQGSGQVAQGQGQGDGQGQRQAGQGQGQGQGEGQGRPQGGPRGQGGPQAAGTPNPQSPIVNGEVDIIDGRTVTVATNTGWRKVDVPDSATIQTEGKGTPADLVTGALVGVTGKPDGTAVSIRIFPTGATPRTGQFPMNGAQTGNVMTNAKIEGFDGKTLSLDFEGQKASITVPPAAEIVKPVPAAFSDIQVGARVQANGSVSGDTLTARSVTLLPNVTQRAGAGTGRSPAASASTP
jgi:hypothetical protein